VGGQKTKLWVSSYRAARTVVPPAAFRAADARSHHRSASVILLVAIDDGVQKSVDARIEPSANLITIVATNADIPENTPRKISLMLMLRR
jgi:hypothetical protein